MVTTTPPAPVPAAWRLRLADRIAGGELTRRGQLLEARPDHHARTVLGAVLARPEVRAAVPDRLYAHWVGQYGAGAAVGSSS